MSAGPETLRQARRWDVWNGQYRRLLSCATCSAQWAWGRALGWSKVLPPCADCRVVVGPTWASARVEDKPAVNGEPASALVMTDSAVPASLSGGEAHAGTSGREVGRMTGPSPAS